jgi:hypothetical protein
MCRPEQQGRVVVVVVVGGGGELPGKMNIFNEK